MMYPYAEFLIDFQRRHGSFVHRNTASNTKAAVVIESRPLYFLPAVLRNVMFFLGGGWNLYVFSGELSDRYIEDVLRGWEVQQVKLEGLVHLPRTVRSELMKSSEFWKTFVEDKLLVFESNCVMCGSNVDEFLDYDFIGAPMGTADQFVLNGGFSLRSRRKLIQCIAAGRSQSEEPEDVFFTRMMRQMGAITPDFASASRFAVSAAYEDHPVGVAGTDDSLHSAEVAEKIVAKIAY